MLKNARISDEKRRMCRGDLETTINALKDCHKTQSILQLLGLPASIVNWQDQRVKHGEVISSYIARKNDRTGKRLVKEAHYRIKNQNWKVDRPSTSITTTREIQRKSVNGESSEEQVRRMSRIIQGVMDEEVVRKLQKCLVGTMSTICSSSQVEDRLRSAVQPWSESYRASERVTWIKLFGVSLHCWNHGTFKMIAEQWGECLAMGENTFQAMGCEEMTILITTSRKESIDEIVDLEASRDIFKIRAVEQPTSRSDNAGRKQEEKEATAMVDFESLTGRSSDSSDEKKLERWQEKNDSQLCCMGNIPRGGDLSGEDEDDRNIGEEAIVGLRKNDDGWEKEQKQIEEVIELEERDVEEVSRILLKNAGVNEEMKNNLNDLSSCERLFESKAVEDMVHMGFTNDISNIISNSEEAQHDGILFDGEVGKSNHGIYREDKDQRLGLSAQMKEDFVMLNSSHNQRSKVGKNKKYFSMQRFQEKYVVTQRNNRKCIIKKNQKKVLNEEEVTELEGRSLSDFDLQARWQRQKMKAKETLQIGRELGIQFIGSEEESVQSWLVCCFDGIVCMAKIGGVDVCKKIGFCWRFSAAAV
ncbi:hypothetical protein F3Y22_tig00112699pilonHSYRG00082 [Hibiscus syriacus]|uniref:DUF4283 domain-containing protein n=1 Tax=Hibiscus syriacus TaxID=106335 RepID=A0A6A2Y485_HIBSY|nr:hypothetical protein F3Y22_tig00112699pilonHSYRG00082 [Hibiscus syriacus]